MTRRYRTRAEITRSREADWVFLLDTGYMAYVPCWWCEKMKECRGRSRRRMTCHDCFIRKGFPRVRSV